jgi:hypothetical protein
MSDADSFIEEVTEEVRRDRMFLMLKRYGWIGAVAVALIVGGAGWREYTRSEARDAAEKLGDQMLAALSLDESAARAEALAAASADTPGGRAVLQMLQAGALENAGDTAAAVAKLEEVATDGEVQQIYRAIASFKALTLQHATLAPEDLRLRYEALAQPGAPLRLLAEEQLALLEIKAGQTDAAISRLRAIIADAEARTDLKDRASQVIVALGGNPEAEAPSQG